MAGWPLHFCVRDVCQVSRRNLLSVIRLFGNQSHASLKFDFGVTLLQFI